ncbi:hypothetical protein PROFUN_08055 [Planoprotostelium fungivorum]|uniref:Uncharacterized protein n=1 Tax=Planoprotostelium fungivorum TaxID=1890364 RepID=A0A2P6NKG8_9EUKA|nr:hypothetical protein PROFUN_08055 [Planoprotostelium fungivorum]
MSKRAAAKRQRPTSESDEDDDGFDPSFEPGPDSPEEPMQVEEDPQPIAAVPSAPRERSAPAAPVYELVPETKDESPDAIFQHMYLKTLLKENHGQEIGQVLMNSNELRFHNMVATVGDNQANIYDNENMGKHLDLYLHFINKETPLSDPKTKVHYGLKCCCWMKESGGENELRDDVYLAVGGEDKMIHIISVKRTKVVTLLRGHTGTIIDLQPHPTQPSLLLSVGTDSTVRLWDLQNEEPGQSCLRVFQFGANVTVASFYQDGTKIVAGGAGGILKMIDIEDVLQNRKTIKIAQDKKHHTTSIDCIRCIGDTIITKSVDGRIIMWDPKTGKVDTEMRIYNTRNTPSRFDVSRDGGYLVCGNAEGQVYIFKTSTGTVIRKLEHKRLKAAVKSAAFSKDSKNILFCTSDCLLWRFDYISPQTINAARETQIKKKDNAEK